MSRFWKQGMALVALAAAAGLWCVTASLPAKPPGGGVKPGSTLYTLVPLPDELGATNFNGYAIGLHELRGGSGQLAGVEVVGILSGRAHYWRLNASGTVLDVVRLPLPAGADPDTTVTEAKDINDSGIVVGSGGTLGAARPLLWRNLESTPISLPVPAVFQGNAHAVNINNRGLVVGWLSASDGVEYDVAWGIKADGTVVGPVALGHGDVWAPNVNDAGIVVATINYQAYRWQVGWNGQSLTVSAPETLIATRDSQTFPLTTVSAVNERGDICGTYQPDGWQAYLLTVGGQLIDMPLLVDNVRMSTRNWQTSDLNDAATADLIQVAGAGHTYRRSSGVIERPVVELLWQGSRATDLQAVTDQPNSQLSLHYFSVVGDAGWLAGFAGNTNDDPRAVVLVPK